MSDPKQPNFPPPLRRMSVYLSGVSSPFETPFEPGANFDGFIANASLSDAELIESALRQPAARRYIEHLGEDRFPDVFKLYMSPVVSVFRRHNIGGDFAVFVGDGMPALEVPTFCKARRLAEPRRSVLFPIKKNRHFGPIKQANDADIPFQEKNDRLVWRGATTGNFRMDHPNHAPGSRAFIPSVINRVSNANFDIGYTDVTANIEKSNMLESEIKNYVREKISITDHLKSKYILCLEGNDVATGLKWILGSNSVPVMPHPTVESWACESLLRPFKHYVPVKSDLSDVEDVYRWCQTHPKRCEQIAINGKAFIAAFLDKALEKRIQRRVAVLYSERVKFKR